MTIARYLEAIAFLLIAFIPIGVAARAWRRRLLPGWNKAPAYLCEIILSLATIEVVAELAGTVHLFAVWAVVPMMAAAGGAGWVLAERIPQEERQTDEPERVRRTAPPPFTSGPLIAAIAAVSLLVANWATRTVDSLRHGMNTADTLWYHMPFAARFVQQETIVPLHYVDAESVTVFFPASSELFHGLGIVLMGSDFLSPFLNLAWMAMTILAAWCIGRPFGQSPATVVGVAALLATPGLVATQPGGAYDDIVGLALFLAALAMLMNAAGSAERTRWNAQAIAALSAGMALGTKFTFIGPVAALTVGVIVLARKGRRLPEAGMWFLLLAITGGFWYVRNLLTVGNPLPSLHFGFGPLQLPSPAATSPSSTFAQFVLRWSDWRRFFFPGLRLSFGPVWWAMLSLAVLGLVLGVVASGDRTRTMVAWVGIASVGAFVVTPQYLTILGAPVYFVDNVRYADPGIAIGLAMLPLIRPFQRGRRSWLVLGSYVAIIGVTQLDGTLWPTSWLGKRFAPPVEAGESWIGLAIGLIALLLGLVIWIGRRRQWRTKRVPVVMLICALGVAAFGLQQSYLRNKYTSSDATSIVAWAQHVAHARIGLAGDYTQLQYGFYGQGLTNYVQYVARPEPHHGYAPIRSCREWRTEVNRGKYNYVVTSSNPTNRRSEIFASPSSYSAWTHSDPAARLLLRSAARVSASAGGGSAYVGFTLFQLTGPLDPNTCPQPE